MNVCIFGLGRIGLPIALVCANSNLRVVGIDVNDKFSIKCRESKFPSAVWSDFKNILGIDQRNVITRKVIEKYTKGSVFTILENLDEQPSIVALLTSMKLRDAYEFLKRLDGISHKIAALFLRDISSYFGGWRDVEEKDLYCLHPVDRWVKELAKICWNDLKDKEPEKIAKDVLRVKNLMYIKENRELEDLRSSSVMIFCGECEGFDGDGNCPDRFFNRCAIRTKLHGIQLP